MKIEKSKNNMFGDKLSNGSSIFLVFALWIYFANLLIRFVSYESMSNNMMDYNKN
jgi:hypothetical protein